MSYLFISLLSLFNYFIYNPFLVSKSFKLCEVFLGLETGAPTTPYSIVRIYASELIISAVFVYFFVTYKISLGFNLRSFIIIT